MKRSSGIIVVAIMVLLLFSGSGYAMFIDFRTDTPFSTDQPDGFASYSAAVGGLTLTFTPLPPTGTTRLYWDDEDGFGVKGGGGYEPDEIEDPEFLKISFSSPTYVQFFDLTDLYYEDGYTETGKWSLDNNSWNQFSQTDLTKLPDPLSNGEYRLVINSIVSDIWFTALGEINIGCDWQDHDFSVAAVNTAVPEPATMLLLGSGLLGLAGFRRKMKIRRQ